MGKNTRIFSDLTDSKFGYDTSKDENLSWFRALSQLTLWIFETPKKSIDPSIKNNLDFIRKYFGKGKDSLIEKTINEVKDKRSKTAESCSKTRKP